ncbi:hypothetical protein BX600DRAFT_534972 [Xylariales sp. PMI_506]|nr:hypothetical protein BX600DRAFT_534972 [Xylariales sp. PMI_506]
MSIAALPESTKHLLCSSLVMVNPASLVKELIDNSIDAKSTTIEVYISLNTVDKIEVRDNGTGIHSNDYDALARPGHTSKLQTFDQLATLAGTSLGFRGEALASINSVASKLTITTRTPSDSTASVLQLHPKVGGVLQRQPCSGPVGTTVSVHGLYDGFHVRKRTAIKEAGKTLDSIKELLRSYALARPHLKIMFKSFGTPKLNWSYSPKPESDIREAILQLFGAEVSARLVVNSINFGGSAKDTAAPDTPYSFTAVTESQGADIPELHKHRYLAIDKRPVKGRRGMMKKLNDIYTKYLSNASLSGSKIRTASYPFFQLNIDCPPGSYDVNIEPAKDDVLFDNEFQILEYFETFCARVYDPFRLSDQVPTILYSPALSASCQSVILNSSKSRPMDNTADVENQFEGISKADMHPYASSTVIDTGLAQSPSSVSREESSHPIKPLSQPLVIRQKLHSIITPSSGNTFLTSKHESSTVVTPSRSDMGTKSPRTGILSDMSIDFNVRVNENQSTRKPKQTNSTIMPGMNAPVGFASTAKPQLSANPAVSASMTKSQLMASPRVVTPQETFVASTVPEPEVLQHPARPSHDLCFPLIHHHLNFSNNRSNSPSIKPFMSHESPDDITIGTKQRHSKSKLPNRRAQLPWTPPSSVQKNRHDCHNPHSSRQTVLSDGLKQTEISFTSFQPREDRQTLTINTQHQADSRPFEKYGISNPLPHLPPGFSTARQTLVQMENASRKSQATAMAPAPQPRNDNRKGRECASVLPGHFVTESKVAVEEPIATSLVSGDPRAYLLRRQKSMAISREKGQPNKIRRIRSNLLPLENIPTGDQIHNVTMPIQVDSYRLPQILKSLENYDKYLTEGDIEEALDIDLGETRRIEQRLDETLATWVESVTGERADIKSGLTSVVKGKGRDVTTVAAME